MGMTPIQRYRLKQSLARIRNKKQYLLELKKQQKKRKNANVFYARRDARKT